jgi:hypothetical protein
MMLWLQEMGETLRFDFEVNGDKALVSCARLKPSGFVPLFGAAKGLIDHIPRIVFRDHAPATPAPGHLTPAFLFVAGNLRSYWPGCSRRVP